MTIDCEKARGLLRGEREERRDPNVSDALRAHVASCAACAHVEAEERVFDHVLQAGLPRRAAPAGLRERLEAQVAVGRPPRRPARAPLRTIGLALSLAAASAAAVLLYVHSARLDAHNPVVREALNDHLRVLYAAHPVEIESGGIHQVKPWFSGRVDFAPDVAFSGDDDFPLVGGAVSYFIDRKAATFVWKRRLHTISLVVFRSQGLPWPRGGQVAIGNVSAQLAQQEGFHLLLWRAHDLGHVLVSDAGANELVQLGRKIVQSE